VSDTVLVGPWISREDLPAYLELAREIYEDHMASTQTTSPISGKVAARMASAMQAHAKDETKFGMIELPAGIENGVAQLVDCRIMRIREDAKRGAGELMFFAAGIVRAPALHKGTPITGLRTQISEHLYDDDKRTNRQTVEDQTGWVMNELAKLGLDRANQIKLGLEKSCQFLMAKKPHFRFRTWKPSKSVIAQDAAGKWRVYDIDEDGRQTLQRDSGEWKTKEQAEKAVPWANGKEKTTVHMWGGAVDYTPPKVSKVQDTSGPETATPSTNGTAVAHEEPAALPAADAEEIDGADQHEADQAPPDDGSKFSEFEDLDSLAEQADSKDKKVNTPAREKLQEMADKVGVPAESFEAANSWREVADLIQAAQEESGGGAAETPEPEEPVEEFVPAKGLVVMYTPPGKDKKTKEAFEERECKVVIVNAAKKVVHLKDLENKGVEYKDIKFADVRPTKD
jgi:hypothetical protein